MPAEKTKVTRKVVQSKTSCILWGVNSFTWCSLEVNPCTARMSTLNWICYAFQKDLAIYVSLFAIASSHCLIIIIDTQCGYIIIIDIHSLCRIFPQDLPIDSKESFLAHRNPLENIWSYTCRFIVCHVGPPQRLCDPCVVTLCITAMTEHRSWHSGPPGRLRLERGQSQKLRNPYMFLSKWLNLVGKSLILQAIILRGALCWNVNFEGDWRGRFSDLIWGAWLIFVWKLDKV